jgi:hypothetical protein
MKLRFAVGLFVLFLLVGNGSGQQQQQQFNGYWWAGMNPSFRLGWVSGYAKAMDFAGTVQMGSCAANMPMYRKEFPNTDPKVLVQKLCLSDTQFDYDGIAMGQFVDGIDAFYGDFRNKQLETGWAIEYVRDEVKGKPASELDTKVNLWRRCTAAMRTGDKDKIAKACTPDSSPQQ